MNSDKLKDFRIKEILKFPYKGKRVLNVGCVQNPEIHFELANRSSSLIGIDLDADGLKKFKERDFEVYLMNAEQIRFDKKFDIIIAGEIIEHLNNPGIFLESALNHINENGKIIISTPNISSILLYFFVVVLNRSQDPTHVFYFDEKNLESLVLRYDLRVHTLKYIPPSIKGKEKFGVLFYLGALFANLGFYFSKRLFGSYIFLILENNRQNYEKYN